MPDLAVSHLRKVFEGNEVLADLSFTVDDGEFFTLLGPSGCGKSTTLTCLAGLERPDGGSIRVGDETFYDEARNLFRPAEARNLGMVFQSYALWPHMTISQNVGFPLKLRNTDARARARLIDEALEKVGLTGMQKRYPHQLSGGQQQRVALARALAYSPTVLLLDEPLSNLDAKLRDQARVWLKQLQADLGITTVYVTHDQEEALALSDRIAVMSKGDMVQIDTPEAVYSTPASAEVANFVGRSNFLRGTVVSGVDGDGYVDVELVSGDRITAYAADRLGAGESTTVAVRPESLAIGSPGIARGEGDARFEIDVVGRSYVGNRVEYLAALGEERLQFYGPLEPLDAKVSLGAPARSMRAYRIDA